MTRTFTADAGRTILFALHRGLWQLAASGDGALDLVVVIEREGNVRAIEHLRLLAGQPGGWLAIVGDHDVTATINVSAPSFDGSITIEHVPTRDSETIQ